MTTTATPPTCPFPELRVFCGTDYWATPRCDGQHWFATDGKLVAFREAPAGAPSDVPDGVGATFRRIVAAHRAVQVWHQLPPAMPEFTAEQGRPCTHCKGEKTVEATEPCEACEGDGDCPHCGQECTECLGEGRVSTGQPAGPCPYCAGVGWLPPSAVRIGGLLMGWDYARRLVDARASIYVDRDCRCHFLVRWDGVDLAIMDVVYGEDQTQRFPELVLGEAVPRG